MNLKLWHWIKISYFYSEKRVHIVWFYFYVIPEQTKLGYSEIKPSDKTATMAAASMGGYEQWPDRRQIV